MLYPFIEVGLKIRCKLGCGVIGAIDDFDTCGVELDDHRGVQHMSVSVVFELRVLDCANLRAEELDRSSVLNPRYGPRKVDAVYQRGGVRIFVRAVLILIEAKLRATGACARPGRRPSHRRRSRSRNGFGGG